MFHRPAAEYCLSRRSVQGLNRMACDEEAINLRGCLKSCTLDNKRNFSSLLMNPGHWRNLVIEKTVTPDKHPCQQEAEAARGCLARRGVRHARSAAA
ncbi:hypothetical protein WJX72_009690 [[Myrmecia] bisecta]|uniref:Uncharacterized protein n=1 Tax=[Myrmecia] bisecta TaxID=41462 RepID=A0AAW1PD20_9CHLO